MSPERIVPFEASFPSRRDAWEPSEVNGDEPLRAITVGGKTVTGPCKKPITKGPLWGNLWISVVVTGTADHVGPPRQQGGPSWRWA